MRINVEDLIAWTDTKCDKALAIVPSNSRVVIED